QIKVLLTLLIALFLSISCAKNNPNNPSNINDFSSQNGNETTTGKPSWKQNANYTILIKDWYNEKQPQYNEVYQIRENGNNKIDFIVPDPAGDVSYSISIVEIIWNSDNTSGIMYGTYTMAPSWSPDYLNKWYAISFKSLSANTLSISQAMLSDGSASAETFEEAKSIFTEENNAFSYYSDLVPQTK
ncbi:hypothetical protein, partial [Brachyspira hampsonii]|uniref:hypothetical protein n=1 Tax=Brachyspira hampsonii TaxID=1287055 RepID=UPI0021558755